MIAALPMYDWPETRGLNDIIWARISAKLDAAGVKSPPKLTRPNDLEALWLSPDLLLAQTCSYPLETSLKGNVKYVATPSYSVDGCEIPGHYRSVILMRGSGPNLPVPDINHASLPNWLTSLCFAINGLNSMSGYHALKRDAEASGQSLSSRNIQTGSHRASIVAVAEGRADFCAVDCVSWGMAQTHEPAAKNVHAAGWTKQRPGLPLITSLQTSQTVLSALVAAAQSVLAGVVLTMPTEF